MTERDANARWFGRDDAFEFLDKDRDNASRLDKVVAFLARHAADGQRLLDVGCGDGRIGKRFADLGYTVHGLDTAPENVQRARELGIAAVEGDAADPLPFEDASFDVVFAGEIIEHLFDTGAFLAELSRVLRPGGWLVLTTPNLAHLPDRLLLLLGHSPGQVQPGHPFLRLHIRPFTVGTLREALEEAGFDLERSESTMVVLRRDPRDPDRVQLGSALLARLFPSFGSFILAYARKRPG